MRRLVLRVHLGERTKEQAVVGHREKDAWRREQRAVQRAERREHHGDRHERYAPVAHQHLRGIRGDEPRVCDLRHREDREVREVGQQVDHHHGQRADDQRLRQRLLRILHFPAHETQVGPPVERPQRTHQRQPKGTQCEAPLGGGRREVPTRLRQPDREREHDDERQGAVLGEGRQVLHQTAPAHTQDVERRCERDCSGSDIPSPVTVRRQRRVVAAHAQRVLGERDRDGAHRRGADHHEFRPAEQKGRQPAPPFADVDIQPASLRVHTRDLGQRERAAQRHDAACHPDHHQRKRAGKLLRDAGRRPEDAGSDGRADEHGDGTPQAKLPAEGGSGGSGHPC